jgi:hypothetical protein
MARTLSGWLKEQDPDVWYVTTDYLNWDNSGRILKWIVSQPQCDKANAAKIFWLADPSFYAAQIAKGAGVPAWSESWPLVETILNNWRQGFYQRSELAWPDDEGRACINTYRDVVASMPGADKAIDIPADLFGPIPGREPKVPPELTPQENAELWDMLDKQGSRIGPRPDSDQWKAERAKAAQTGQKRGFWGRLFG